jgi:putative transposase
LFFDDADRRAYVGMLAAACARHGTACLAWCLMDNHVHLILVPGHADGLRAPLASVHTSYSQRVNRRHKLSGHLFQGRFASYAMDDRHLMAAARYIENNPVAAGRASRAEEWLWSSARAHVHGTADGLTDIAALAQHVPNWGAMLVRGLEAGGSANADPAVIERALCTGRPVGGDAWLAGLAGALPPLRRRGRPRSAAPPAEQLGTVPI